MNNQLIESFVKNALRTGAHCIVVKTADEIQAAIQPILDAEKNIFCANLTTLERSIRIPHISRTSDVVSASAAIEEVPYGIAESGSIVIVGSSRKRLEVSLLPQHHIALLPSGGIYNTFLDLVKTIRSLPSNITLITGPSRTADIEKTLVLGMHGPSRVTVVVVVEERPAS